MNPGHTICNSGVRKSIRIKVCIYRDRTTTRAARAREVDKTGGVGIAGVAGAAGPLGGPAGHLRVIWTLRSCHVREAQQEAQQEDQSIQPRASARVTAHARGV